ncbi:hypothetical protein TNCT_606071 [Trichonephila clavata]|uniref:Uncharacterized protein n=1 Tax=Trichonephila clavata TaxID=2740835 RepID=A0A8X6LWY0_TRICU|nr:hypothetical protein TNCT_606071 [Trichonephila clavata]
MKKTKVIPVLGLNLNLPSDILSTDTKYFSEKKEPLFLKDRFCLCSLYFRPDWVKFSNNIAPKLLLQECWRMVVIDPVVPVTADPVPVDPAVPVPEDSVPVPANPVVPITVNSIFPVSEDPVIPVSKDSDNIIALSYIFIQEIRGFEVPDLNYILSKLNERLMIARNGTFLRLFQILYPLEVGEPANFLFPRKEPTLSVADGHSSRETPSVPNPLSTKTDHEVQSP